MNHPIGIIGGDMRQRYLAEFIKMPFVVFGNDGIEEHENVAKIRTLSELLLECTVLCVPTPFSIDGKTIYAKNYDEKIYIMEFLKGISKQHLCIGGPYPNEVREQITAVGAKYIDITALETFKLKNAIPTAEGVLSELILKRDQTIHNSKALVIGYGYCGKRMTYSLNRLGAKVDVFTINDLEKKQVANCQINCLDRVESLEKYDYIINTIPVVLIENIHITEKQLFIDITDAYTLQFEEFIRMKGIPGKYTPKTAGRIIGELINDIIMNVTGENS